VGRDGFTLTSVMPKLGAVCQIHFGGFINITDLFQDYTDLLEFLVHSLGHFVSINISTEMCTL